MPRASPYCSQNAYRSEVLALTNNCPSERSAGKRTDRCGSAGVDSGPELRNALEPCMDFPRPLMKPQNLFSPLPAFIPEEIFDILLQTDHLKLERIVSAGQATPPGEWYDQETHEWVILLSGSAGLTFADEPGLLVLKPGDYVHIPAHTRHRVEWTDAGQKTVWLALHYR